MGLVVQPDTYKDRTDLQFSTRVPHSDQMAILGPLHFRQDTSDYVSEILIQGAFDPGRGERITSYWRRYEASQKRGSAYFTGIDYTYVADADESIKTQTKADMFALYIAAQKGIPPVVTDALIWWQPTYRTGMIVRVDGIKFVMKRIQRSGLQVAKQQQATVQFRLAEDVEIDLA